jgi:hypothetical protein
MEIFRRQVSDIIHGTQYIQHAWRNFIYTAVGDGCLNFTVEPDILIFLYIVFKNGPAKLVGEQGTSVNIGFVFVTDFIQMIIERIVLAAAVI